MSKNKKIITENEKEEFCVNAYNYIDKLESENKSIKQKLKDLSSKIQILEKEYLDMKEKYNEICLLNIGKGEYSQIMKQPKEIKGKIEKLESSGYDDIKIRVDYGDKKERERLVPVLKEDLQNAEEEVRKLEEECERITEGYEQKRSDLNSCKKEYSMLNKKLRENSKKISYFLKKIKYVERIYNSNKPIHSKKLELK